MLEDLKLSQIGSSPLPPPFRGLHSPGVRKHCQIIFACYFRKSSIQRRRIYETYALWSTRWRKWRHNWLRLQRPAGNWLGRRARIVCGWSRRSGWSWKDTRHSKMKQDHHRTTGGNGSVCLSLSLSLSLSPSLSHTHTHTHTLKLKDQKRTTLSNWCMVVWCTQNVLRDGSNLAAWHQSCNNWIML